MYLFVQELRLLGLSIGTVAASGLLEGLNEGFLSLSRLEICVRSGDSDAESAAASIVRLGKDRAYTSKVGVSVLVNQS